MNQARLNIRLYNPKDEQALLDIYTNSELGTLWPIAPERLLNVLFGYDDTNNKVRVFVAELNNKIVGVISAKNKQVGDENRGVITLVVVTSEYRNNKVGTSLINATKDWFDQLGVKTIKLGGGAGSWLWAGVPENLNSINFFSKNGFLIENELVYDMYQNIETFKSPKGIYEKINNEGIRIQISSPEYAEQILDFERKNFLEWHDYYKQDFDNNNYNNVFMAIHNKEIIGVTCIQIENCNWNLLFENKLGSGKALGVSEKWRGKGVGLALKSYGTELLKSKGIKYCWIGWTDKTDFYSKLGFEIWRKYFRAELRI